MSCTELLRRPRIWADHHLCPLQPRLPQSPPQSPRGAGQPAACSPDQQRMPQLTQTYRDGMRACVLRVIPPGGAGT